MCVDKTLKNIILKFTRNTLTKRQRHRCNQHSHEEAELTTRQRPSRPRLVMSNSHELPFRSTSGLVTCRVASRDWAVGLFMAFGSKLNHLLTTVSFEGIIDQVSRSDQSCS